MRDPDLEWAQQFGLPLLIVLAMTLGLAVLLPQDPLPLRSQPSLTQQF